MRHGIRSFFASLKPDLARIGGLGENGLGIFHIGTGLFLMYLMWAAVLNLVLKYTLPL